MQSAESFVASLARTINAAGVPCVLWGHWLLQVHGVPTITQSIDFVVPDGSLNRAVDAISLRTADLVPCPDPDGCLASSPQRPTPTPSFHLHLDDPDAGVTVELFAQSDTLWFLPSLNDMMPPHSDQIPPGFVVASDRKALPPRRPGRGSGHFIKGCDHPVIVPCAHVLTEALLRIYARDVGKPAGRFAVAHVLYMQGYVDEDGLLDVSKLPTILRDSYMDLKSGKRLRYWTQDLQEALGVPCSPRIANEVRD